MDLNRNFDYHAPDPDDRSTHEKLRAACKDLAEFVVMACPNNAERQTALQRIEEAMMWGNASIARGPGEIVVTAIPAQRPPWAKGDTGVR